MEPDRRDEPTSPIPEPDSTGRDRPDTGAIADALDAALSINTEVHRLILGYAAAAAIVAALPSAAWVYELKLVAVLVLNGFMVRGIGRRWGSSRGPGPLTVGMAALGMIGALAVTAMAFMVVFSISLYVPVIRSWAEAAAYFALTLAVGRVANEYFQGARRVDRERLDRILAARGGRASAAADDGGGGRSGWNRRHLIIGGLGLGLAAGSTADFLRWRRQRAGPARADDAEYDNPFVAAYATEVAWQDQVRSTLAVDNGASLSPPTEPYDREIARRMIFACKAAVMQHRIGMSTADYDGNVIGLEEFEALFGDEESMAGFIDGGYAMREAFGRSRQLASFVAEEEFYGEYFQVENPPPEGAIQSPIRRTVRPVEDVLYEAVPKLLRREFRLPVFVGYVLEAERANIIVFRGTQTSAEWLHNLRSGQRRMVDPGSGKSYGWLHGGFLAMAEKIRPTPEEIAEKLDPSKPTYITGHSLGSALATISALKLALARPELAGRMRLYSFAGPRVGDPTFAEAFGALLPNVYRVVNLADGVPMVPASTMGKTFVHVGQQVSFVGAFGDLLLNHVVDAYQMALDRGVESAEDLPSLRT